MARSLTLSNGVALPTVGFGCAGRLGSTPLGQALDAGYALFDTAQANEWYDEAALGQALRETSANRSSLFLTSKLHPRDLGEQPTLDAFPVSLRRLGTTYLDAFLLHYPRCFGSLCAGREPRGDWKQSWRALEKLYEDGLVRAIGVSNFAPAELLQLVDWARTGPHIVQSWMDPLMQARELRAICSRRGIVFQAYSTLGTQHRTPFNPVLKHGVVRSLAAEVNRSEAQVVLRWALQRGVAVIPRASKPKHMAANAALYDFSLTGVQLAQIDALDGADPALAVPSPPPKLCEDDDPMCARWADDGECEANTAYMHAACAGSCNTCDQRHRVEL